MEDLITRLNRGEILVSDGAIGTMLIERGLNATEPPEIFNLKGLDVLFEIANLYLEAGANIVQTNTFGASPLKLSLYSLDNKTEEINMNAVYTVRKAIDNNAYILGSCGPSGRLLKPYGDTEEVELHKNFERQIKSLINAEVDIICIETMTDLREAEIAVKVAKEISSSIPVIATMTFDPTPKGFYTVMGVSIKDAATRLESVGADILGSNCGNGIVNMIKIAREFKKHTNKPIIIQSNAGIPEIKEGKSVYPESPQFMAEKARELVKIGVSIIGGCCGTTPDHIRAIRNMIDSTNSPLIF
jgi:5-methyltetrahydrofolate--homocysteine methyltransferase